MARKDKCPECKKGAPGWMVTFTDMTQLLLTFFILLLSFATIDPVRIVQAVSSFTGGRGVLDVSKVPGEYETSFIEKIVSTRSTVEDAKYKVLQSLNQYIDETNTEKLITVVEVDGIISIRVLDSVLFAPGSADLVASARPVLEKIGYLLVDVPFPVNIEGHTDSTPINTSEFKSNWELSMGRALRVTKYFQELGVSPNSMSATGFGEFHPLVPNLTPRDRAINRRIEINVLSNKLSASGKKGDLL